MRTIRRISRPLNKGKWEAVNDLARRSAAEKQSHLTGFTDAQFAASPKKERTRRDVLVKAGYVNPHGLQARQWKAAEKDAYETVDRQWAALAEAVRPLVGQHTSWSEAARHYAFWLLKDARRLAALVSGRAPVPTHFTVMPAEQKQVRNYLRRVVRRKRGAHPTAKTARSFALDANMYTVFEQVDGAQFISVMSLTPRQRIVVPLTGTTPILGNVRLVLDFERQRVEVHYTAEVKTPTPLSGEPCGLDAGISEVFTDEQGTRYAPEFGEVIRRASDEICDRGRKRNKLFQLAKKAEAKGDPAKARRIRKFNLGRKKLRARQRRQRAEMERLINTAIRQVARERQPQTITTEKLDLRGKAQSKKISRRVSQWTRNILKERTEFLASVEGFHRQQVNPAYTSQTCPNETCGFVHAGNRRGDTFQCLHCGHADVADRVAAHNLKARLFDSEITLYTPRARVKEILLARFNARLEREGRSITNPTVSGRTPGTHCKASQPESETPTAIGFGQENGGAKCV